MLLSCSGLNKVSFSQKFLKLSTWNKATASWPNRVSANSNEKPSCIFLGKFTTFAVLVADDKTSSSTSVYQKKLSMITKQGVNLLLK